MTVPVAVIQCKTFSIVNIFNFKHYSEFIIMFHFGSISLITNVEHFFVCLSAILIYSFVNYLHTTLPILKLNYLPSSDLL